MRLDLQTPQVYKYEISEAKSGSAWCAFDVLNPPCERRCPETPRKLHCFHAFSPFLQPDPSETFFFPIMHGSVAMVAHKQTCCMFIASSVTLWQVLRGAKIAKNALKSGRPTAHQARGATDFLPSFFIRRKSQEIRNRTKHHNSWRTLKCELCANPPGGFYFPGSDAGRVCSSGDAKQPSLVLIEQAKDFIYNTYGW